MTKLLMVDDDADFAAILKESLEEDDDIEVVTIAACENEAMQLISSGVLKSIDAALLDLQMPMHRGDSKLSSTAGLRILEEIRQGQRFFGTVIVLTNSRNPEDGQRALAAGCDGYLCKHAPTADLPAMIAELKMALRGDVMIVASEMRHVFFREEVSAKEARLMDLLCEGKGWPEIARELSYKTPKAAANIADRLFDKLLTRQDREAVEVNGIKKRNRAVEIWKSRHGDHNHSKIES